jgi:transposase
VYHPLDESQIPSEVLRHPHARRFYRFVRDEIELPQRQVRILEHYQEVIAVDNLREVRTTMIAAPMPEPLMDRCLAGNSLLAYLAVSRFADHLPYYREEDILRRSGISIPRSTQWRWMRNLADVVSPLVTLMRQRLLTCHVLGIDETPCPILDPELPYTRSAYLYAQYGDDSQPFVGYYFADRKTRNNIEKMLTGFQGVLQSDAYICYELITDASLDQIKPAACWALGRRKFEPLLIPGRQTQASWVLREIQRLYDIEDRAREMSHANRHALRQLESRPIVERIHAWLLEREARERPRSALRAGVNYFLNRWEAFTRFLENGAIPIDNNRTEAVIRGPVMGKKAWLFLGNETAGEAAANLYTLVMTCKRHRVDPYAYLLDVLDRIKSASPEGLEALLPHRWIQSHPEAYLKERANASHAAAYRKRTRRAARRQKLAKR